MKVIVDVDICTGCGLCEETCPSVFHLEEDVAVVKADPVPVDREAACRKAYEECPVEAIIISE